MIKELKYPFTEEAVRALKVGDRVCLSGKVFTGRDCFHKFLHEGGVCPLRLEDGAIYHCGPVVVGAEKAWKVRAAGPTTSIREELYTPGVIERYKVRVIIGKGGMGEATRLACKKYGCVYLQAVGGAAALLTDSVKEVLSVHFLKEFGAAEAVWELEMSGFEAVVALDASGRSIHRNVRLASRRILKKFLQN